jgi:hypothetical protein
MFIERAKASSRYRPRVRTPGQPYYSRSAAYGTANKKAPRSLTGPSSLDMPVGQACAQPRSPAWLGGGGGSGGGGGGGGVGQAVPAGTDVPSGHIVGGGGGGGGGIGQGAPAATWDPSGQVCIGGVVAQADSSPVAARSTNALISVLLFTALPTRTLSLRERSVRRDIAVAKAVRSHPHSPSRSSMRC